MFRFRLVGVPHLLAAEGDLRERLERRDAALLALLMLAGPQPRARLAGWLWPQATSDRARNSLRQRLHRMKRSIGTELVSDSGALHLVPGLVEPLDESLDRLRQDPGMAIGELLEGLSYDEAEVDDWVIAQRASWHRQVIDVLQTWVDECERRGDAERAIQYARRSISFDAGIEASHIRLVRLLYAHVGTTHAGAAWDEAMLAMRRVNGRGPGPELLGLQTLLQSASPAVRVGPSLPAGLLRPPRLVSRQLELQRIESALARGRVVLVEGEAGVGKSRLLQDMTRGCGWLEPVAARLGDAVLPYALLTRWLDALSRHHGAPPEESASELARLIPRLTPPTGPASGPLLPARLLRAVEQALEAWAQPATPDREPLQGSAIDDLQFADGASLDLILNLAADTRPARPAWMFASRPGDRPASLTQWQERLDPRRLERVPLSPLPLDGVVELLESLHLPGLDARVWAPPLLQNVGGHPFDLLDALAEMHGRGQLDFSLPPQFDGGAPRRHEASARRLGRLDPAEHALVQVAAVAGPEFSADLAAAVLRTTPAALAPMWRRLEEVGVFAGAGFAHDLMRQTARAEVPGAMARVLHREVAGWLTGAGLADPAARPARIAVHWEGAVEWMPAAQAFEAAAAEAHDRSASREELLALDGAARAYRQAQHPDGARQAFDCDARRVRLLLALDSADSALATADALVDSATTALQRAAALEVRALVRGERLEAEASLDDAQAAMALTAPTDPPRIKLLAAQRAGAALVRLGRPLEAVELLGEHRGDLDRLDDNERLNWLSDLATTLDYADRRREAIEVFSRTIEEAERLGRWMVAAEAWGNLSVAFLYLNRLDDCLEATRRAVACGQRAGLERGMLLIDEMNLAGALRDLGRFGEYLAIAERLPQQLREAGYASWALNAENDLAGCYAWLGRPELAHRTLTPVPSGAPPMLCVARLFIEARLLRMAIDVRAAADRVRQAHALLVGGAGVGRVYVRLKLALEMARDKPLDVALQEIDVVEAEAERREQFMLAAHAQVLRLELMLRDTSQAPGEAAVAAADAVLRRVESDGMPPGLYAPEVWWLAGRAMQARDPSRATQVFRQARAWILDHALPQLPEVFHRSFLERNPINAAVLQATRQGS